MYSSIFIIEIPLKFHKNQVDIIQIDEYNNCWRNMYYGLFDQMLNLLGFGEHSGNGVPDIFSIWDEAGFTEPVIEEHFGEDGPAKTIITLPLMNKKTKKKRRKKATKKKRQKRLAKKRLHQRLLLK